MCSGGFDVLASSTIQLLGSLSKRRIPGRSENVPVSPSNFYSVPQTDL